MADDACWKPLWRFSPINHGANAECVSLLNKLCVAYAPVLCNLHRLSAGYCVQFGTLVLTSVILDHSHMEERANSVNSCFSLGRWSESWINCTMGAESNKWSTIPLTQIGICTNVGHRISGQLRASLCLPIDGYVLHYTSIISPVGWKIHCQSAISVTKKKMVCFRTDKAEMWKHWNLNLAEGEEVLLTLPVEGNLLVPSVSPSACRKVNFLDI